MMARCTKRLEKELEDLGKNYSELFKVNIDPKKFTVWFVTFDGAKGTLYEGESFTLRLTFGSNYPIEAPEVLFIGISPEHPHVYTNGFICLSTLYDDWTPSLRVSSICLSILSMLSSCDKKARPPNDKDMGRYSSGKSPKDLRWMFEDEKC